MNQDKRQLLTSKLPKGNGTHASLVCIVGAYIIYMAYCMIRNTQTGKSSMSMTTTLILVAIMALVGLAVIGYGLLIWYGIWRRSEDADAEKQKAQGENLSKVESEGSIAEANPCDTEEEG